jgi:hypothetical protein
VTRGGWLLAALLVLQGCASPSRDRAPFPAVDDAFTDEAVVRGVQTTQAQCAATAGAVWAQPPGEAGECLRYWFSGLDGERGRAALFFFSGDLLVRDSVAKGYAGTTPAAVQATVDRVPGRYGVPYVFIGRPGTYGSSGDHKQRRRVAEGRLVSAAIDEIKRRHAIGDIAVAGLSGGGHVVASLLGDRSDIVCAVPTSAVASPRRRVAARGWTIDATGYADSYEPAEHLEARRMHPALRVFVLGDPQDSNVPWPVQTFLADQLRAARVPAEVLQAEGLGPERHFILQSALLVGAMCLQGKTTDEIRQRAAQGLKG